MIATRGEGAHETGASPRLPGSEGPGSGIAGTGAS